MRTTYGTFSKPWPTTLAFLAALASSTAAAEMPVESEAVAPDELAVELPAETVDEVGPNEQLLFLGAAAGAAATGLGAGTLQVLGTLAGLSSAVPNALGRSRIAAYLANAAFLAVPLVGLLLPAALGLAAGLGAWLAGAEHPVIPGVGALLAATVAGPLAFVGGTVVAFMAMPKLGVTHIGWAQPIYSVGVGMVVGTLGASVAGAAGAGASLYAFGAARRMLAGSE